MEWMELLDEAVKYIEDNITESVDADSIAQKINISSSYFQRAFQIFSGYTVPRFRITRHHTMVL